MEPLFIKILLFVAGVAIGHAVRNQAERLEGWDEGFRTGRRVYARDLELEGPEPRAAALTDDATT